MDCREAKRWISVYSDGEIEKYEQDKLIEHLEICEECMNEVLIISKIKNVLTEIYSEKELPSGNYKKVIMNQIRNKYYSRKVYMKKTIAACLIGLCLMISVTPINGKSLAKSISEWVSSLKLTSNGVTHYINSDEKRGFFEGLDKAEVAERITLKFNSIEDAEAEIGRKIIPPGYIPNGYELVEINVEKIDIKDMLPRLILRYEDTGYILKDSPKGDEFMRNAIQIMIAYNSLEFIRPENVIETAPGTNIKMIDISGHKNYMLLDDEEQIVHRTINLLMPKQDIYISLFTDKLNNPDFEMIAEDELIKIAEAIMNTD